VSDPNERSAEIDTLIREARGGSLQAKERLWSLAAAFLREKTVGMVDRRFQARFGESDVCQEVLLRAWPRFDEFRGEAAGEFFKWLLEVLRTRFLNLVEEQSARSRDVHKEAPGHANDLLGVLLDTLAGKVPTPSTIAAANEQRQAVELTISRLKPEYQQVIRLRLFENLAFAEIGRALGRTEEAARKLYVRALQEVADLWKKNHDSAV